MRDKQEGSVCKENLYITKAVFLGQYRERPKHICGKAFEILRKGLRAKILRPTR